MVCNCFNLFADKYINEQSYCLMIYINERYLIDVDDEDDDSTEVGTNSSFDATNIETHDYIIVLNLGNGSTMGGGLELMHELCENDDILDSCIGLFNYRQF